MMIINDHVQTFKKIRESFSINTLDDGLREDMGHSLSIERNFEIMKHLILFESERLFSYCLYFQKKDYRSILKRCEDISHLIRLENLNLIGDYEPDILSYIKKRYPSLMPLYDDTYPKNKRYWFDLNEKSCVFYKEEDFVYLKDDDTMRRPFESGRSWRFFHEEVKRIPTWENSINRCLLIRM